MDACVVGVIGDGDDAEGDSTGGVAGDCGGVAGATDIDAGCGSIVWFLAGGGVMPPVMLWTTFIMAAMLFGFNLDFICGLLRSGSRERSVSAPPIPPPCDAPLVKSPSNFWSGLADCADEAVLASG